MKKLVAMVLCVGILCFLTKGDSTAALSGYSQGWDVSGDLAGWIPNGISSNLAVVDTGGNPNGYLYTSGALPRVQIGAASLLAAITGDFTGKQWTVSVDLSFINGDFDNAWLRFRYHSAAYNGWIFPLTNSFSSNWDTYSVTFDPSWSDAQARANGWLTDLDIDPGSAPSVAWSLNMLDVYSTEIRITGFGELDAGIDNFQVSAVPVPPTMLLLASGLLGLLGLRRRLGK